MVSVGPSVFNLVLCVAMTSILLVALYWVIRLALRDALEDADRRRAQRRG